VSLVNIASLLLYPVEVEFLTEVLVSIISWKNIIIKLTLYFELMTIIIIIIEILFCLYRI